MGCDDGLEFGKGWIDLICISVPISIALGDKISRFRHRSIKGGALKSVLYLLSHLIHGVSAELTRRNRWQDQETHSFVVSESWSIGVLPDTVTSGKGDGQNWAPERSSQIEGSGQKIDFDAEHAASSIVEQWGRIDVWVNCAMATVFAPVAETTAA